MLRIEYIDKYHKDLKMVHDLYELSFPSDEKAPFHQILNKADDDNVDFLAYYDHQLFVGFTYLIKSDELLYIFYFSIKEELRNKGYGSQILNIIKEKYSDRFIFLEIEVLDEHADNAAERKRRKDFYLKNGFESANYRYHYYVDYEVIKYGKDSSPDKWHDLFYEYSNGHVDIDFKKGDEM